VDLSTWIPKADVVRETGISERSLERRIQGKKVRVGYRTVPGRRPLPVLHPADVAAIRAEMVERVTDEGERHTTALVPIRAADALTTLLTTLTKQAPKERPLFLTIKEASEYAGLPVAYLRRLIVDGKLKAISAGGYRIRRRDLDKL
jgi:excisionase family DNA binding protein